MPKPDHLSWAEAGAIPEAFLTAYQALKLVAEMKEGDHVLVHAGAFTCRRPYFMIITALLQVHPGSVSPRSN